MRYFNLIISNPKTGQVYQPSRDGLGFTLGSGGSTFTSFVNGMNDPGAPNIEFDLPVYNFAQSQGMASIRVWGVGLHMIGQSRDLNGANFALSAGMKPGLPLATAAANQAGLIVQGTIYQAYGNWLGPEQTLDLVCYPGAAANNDLNISFNWPAGTSLSQAIQVTLHQAFPQYKAKVTISPNLIQDSAQAGHYDNLAQFANYILQISQQVGIPIYGKDEQGNNKYSGVDITVNGDTIYVYDSTTSQKTTALAFQDLMGQPCWLAPATISFKTVLRADIPLGSYIKFPYGIQAPYALTSAGAATPGAPASSKTAFQGTFRVTEIHHFANLRQPDGDSWTTAFVANPISLGASS